MEIDDNIFQAIQACWTGKASPEQIELVRDWLDTSPKNQDLFERLSKTHYQLAHAQTWKRINSLQGKEKLNFRLKKQKKSFHWKYLVSGVAAACLILFAVTRFIPHEPVPEKTILDLAQVKSGSPKATLIFDNGKKIQLNADDTFEIKIKNTIVKDGENTGLKYELSDSLSTRETDETVEYNTLVVSRGGEYILTLSDGTKVWLNSETELKYPVRFTGNTREVSVKGEAYFEVKRDTLHPFIVHTPYSDTKVLGTSFNVSAYEDETTTAITLVSGKVEVYYQHEKCILKPGWQAVAKNKSGTLETREVDVADYVSWKDGMFEFNDMPLEQLVSQLSRWYDVDFFFANSKIRNFKFTGAIKRSNTLLFMLEFIEKTSNVYFKVNGNVIQIYEK